MVLLGFSNVKCIVVPLCCMYLVFRLCNSDALPAEVSAKSIVSLCVSSLMESLSLAS